MTAGHNALRGSGPGQKPAFDNALVLIAGSTGSALRAVRPSNLHIVPNAGTISFTPRARRFLVTLAPGHHGPRHSCDLVVKRDRGDLRWPPG
jgi:hypothetical protein